MLEPDRGIFIERMENPRQYNMPDMHLHQCHELYFLLSGQRRYLIGHDIYDVVPGNLVIIPKNELHRTTTLNRCGYNRYVVYFYEEQITSWIDVLGIEEFHAFLAGGCIELPAQQQQQIRMCLDEMLEEQNSNLPHSEAAMFCHLMLVILTVLRFGSRKALAQEEYVSRINKAARFISKNYMLPLTLHQVAKLAYMEDTYFSRCFKKYTGFGFREYLIQTRIQAAEKMLKYSEKSISQITEECGFSSSNYFGDVFRRVKGCSPSDYRKEWTIHCQKET